ncbi:hypothetical protein V1478_008369 [Vespula squamosa]|uniref:Integrase catalytic domain-containing protein n=1 Tax=Vespula squamosa TaxID=30214 RepID=A0ABD2ATB4_VESSQ
MIAQKQKICQQNQQQLLKAQFDLKERLLVSTQLEILDEALHFFLDAALELGQASDVPWANLKSKLRSSFSGNQTKILILKNEMIMLKETERTQIIHENHAIPIAEHKGLRTDVQNYIQNCRSCQTKKLVRLKTHQPMTITDTPGEAFDKISMILWVLYPLLLSPKGILTDQGTNFLSELMKAVAKKFKIHQYQTSAYHPQSNGSIEQSHHVLMKFLKHFISDNYNWDNWLEIAMFSYNTSVHEGIQYTPHEVIFEKLTEQITKSQEVASHNLNREKERSKYY